MLQVLNCTSISESLCHYCKSFAVGHHVSLKALSIVISETLDTDSVKNDIF